MTSSLWQALDRNYPEEGGSDEWRSTPGDVVLSAPHAVGCQRDGAKKQREDRTGGLVEAAAKVAGAGFMAATGRQASDPNWDADHPYREALLGLGQIVLDVHGMRDAHATDVCIGRGLTPSDSETRLALDLAALAKRYGFYARLDHPFPAGPRTLTNWLRERGTPCLQLELALRLRSGYPEETVSFLAEAAHLARARMSPS